MPPQPMSKPFWESYDSDSDESDDDGEYDDVMRFMDIISRGESSNDTSEEKKLFGMKMTPTKDKKLKPVFHVMALIGAGFICHVQPDTLQLKLSEMLIKAIKHVSPSDQAAQRASLAFFIDRGYLELCAAQDIKITNLIQIMESMGVKFLGTCKDTQAFPFKIVDLNESPSTTVENGKPIVQGYGTRTSFKCRTGNKTATVSRHGMGKMRFF